MSKKIGYEQVVGSRRWPERAEHRAVVLKEARRVSASLIAPVLCSLVVVAAASGEVTSTDPSESGSHELGEIVVTAQKREQKLSDVGITVVAVNGAQLQAAGVTEVSDLPKIAPGFSIGTSFTGYPIYSLRGVSFNAAQFSAAPAVSTYIDEAILPYPAMTGGMLLDAERVEVLKGPQGTLFGQNATGGSINVIAAKPTSVFSAGVNTEINNFGQTMLGGFVSGPLTETLRARFAAETTHWGDWQEGYYLNNDRNGNQNKGAARLIVDWTPSDDFRVSANLNGNYDHGQLQQSQLAALTPQVLPAVNPRLLGYPLPTNDREADIDPGLNTHADTKLYQMTLRADYDVTKYLTLTSLTNYVRFTSHELRNADSTALPIFNILPTGDDRTFSQELRASGSVDDSRVKYIVGGNYQTDKLDDYIDEILIGYSALPPGTNIDDRYNPRNRQASVFGDIDFEFIPQWTLTTGVRYTSVKESTSGCIFGNAPAAGLLGFIANALRGGSGLPPSTAYVPNSCITINDNVPVLAGGKPDYQPIALDASQKEDNASWRGGLNFKPTPDSLIYGLVSRGFKAGAYPVQASLLNSQNAPVKQEKVTTYELGTKFALFDRSLLVNAAVFYYDYLDKQFFTYTISPVGPDSVLVNVPKANAKGVDADFTVSPVAGLTVRGAITYLKTEVGSYDATQFNGKVINVGGTEFNFAPTWSGTLDAEYRFHPVGNLTPYVGTSALGNTQTYGDLGEPVAYRIPGYATVDARAGVESGNGWRVGLFIRNIADKYYWTSVVPSGDTSSKYSGLPRTFGVNASYKF